MDMRIFRSLFIAALVAGTSPCIGHAGPAAARGVVESVREVQLHQPSAFSGVFELAFKPATADELLVRLDDGQVVTVVYTGMRIFEAGQRVQLLLHPQGTRVERADEPTFFQP